MFRKAPLFLILTVSIVVMLPLTGCEDDPVAPGVEPEIINDPESFEFQVSQVQNYSGTLTYTWSNAESSANIDQSESISSGSVQLTVLDASDSVMHDAALGDGSVASGDGDSGDWTIRVRFTRASGTLNFRLQPRTP